MMKISIFKSGLFSKFLLPTTNSAKDFLKSVKAQSQCVDKSITSALISKLTIMKYDDNLTTGISAASK